MPHLEQDLRHLPWERLVSLDLLTMKWYRFLHTGCPLQPFFFPPPTIDRPKTKKTRINIVFIQCNTKTKHSSKFRIVTLWWRKKRKKVACSNSVRASSPLVSRVDSTNPKEWWRCCFFSQRPAGLLYSRLLLFTFSFRGLRPGSPKSLFTLEFYVISSCRFLNFRRSLCKQRPIS